MPKHHRVSPNFWQGDRRRWNDREKLLAQYLITGPHRNLEGLYFLPKQYVAADLNWSPDIVEETLAALASYGFALYDDEAEVVFLRTALKHQAPKSPAQITGAVNALDAVPATRLWADFLASAAKHAPILADAIASSSVGDRQAPETVSPQAYEPSRDTPETVPNGSLARGSRAHSSNSSSNSNPPNPPRGNSAVKQIDDARDRLRAQEFETWLQDHQAVTGHNPPKQGTKARAALAASFAARREEGYSVDELKLASRGGHADDYRREHGYDNAESVLRPTKIHNLIEKARRAASTDGRSSSDERIAAAQRREEALERQRREREAALGGAA